MNRTPYDDFDRKSSKKHEHPIIKWLSEYVYDNWRNLPSEDELDEYRLSYNGNSMDVTRAYYMWIYRYEKYQRRAWRNSDGSDHTKPTGNIDVLRPHFTPEYESRPELPLMDPEYLNKYNLW